VSVVAGLVMRCGPRWLFCRVTKSFAREYKGIVTVTSGLGSVTFRQNLPINERTLASPWNGTLVSIDFPTPEWI